MRQFDVVANPVERSRRLAPFLVILQSHYLISIETTVAAPLFSRLTLPPDFALSLAVEFEGASYTLALQQLSSIPVKRLGRVVGSLEHYDLDIARAWERLFTGF